MKTLELILTGVAPLLQHNGQTTDPLNPFSRAMSEISSKRKKTEADHRERDRLEFLAGQSVGIGDWRPKYGRFTVEQV